MISLLAFLFVLGVLIVAHEMGHLIAAKRMGIRIEKFSLGFGYKILSQKKGGTEYTIGLVPLGGYVKFAGDTVEEFKGKEDEFLSKPPRQRAFVIFMGPALNYVLGFVCFWIIFFSGYPTLTTKVGSLIDGYGAQKAGLKVGDTVTAVDGKQVRLFEDMQSLIMDRKASDVVKLSVKRDNRELSFDVQIKEKALPDLLGRKKSVGLIGITPAEDLVQVKHGPVASLGLSARKTWSLTVLMYQAFWRMITGNLSMRESVSGPLGIFYITAQAAHLGFAALLHLIAVLSVSLAIFNLLPMPILDGGHIMFLIIERIRGKPLSLKAEQVITQAGLTVLLTLVVLVTYNDIMRFYGDKIIRFLKP
jgi:regulator of sigma E protease